eukprot:5461165-Amphidinium_carterae.1
MDIVGETPSRAVDLRPALAPNPAKQLMRSASDAIKKAMTEADPCQLAWFTEVVNDEPRNRGQTEAPRQKHQRKVSHQYQGHSPTPVTAHAILSSVAAA